MKVIFFVRIRFRIKRKTHLVKTASLYQRNS